MTQEEKASQETLSRWSLDPSNILDRLLLAFSKLLILGCGFVFLNEQRSVMNTTMSYFFYAILVSISLLIASSLLAREKLIKSLMVDTLINIMILLGILTSLALISTIDCSTTSWCGKDLIPLTASDRLICISCMEIKAGTLSYMDSAQLRLSRQGLVPLLSLLGFEARHSHLIYSLIPLQVYIVSFPNSSQAEKITGYMCLVSYVLLCLIKSIHVKVQNNSNKAKKSAKVRIPNLSSITELPLDSIRKGIRSETAYFADTFGVARVPSQPSKEPSPKLMNHLDVVFNIPVVQSTPPFGSGSMSNSQHLQNKRMNGKESSKDLGSAVKHNLPGTDSNFGEASRHSRSKSRKKMLTQGNHNIKMLWNEDVPYSGDGSMLR